LIAAPSTASQDLPSELDDEVGAEAAPSRSPDRNPKGWDLSGKWSPTRAACSPKIAAKTGWLPISISERDARAGETVCALTNKRRLGNAWKATATCSTADARWTSTVRLALEGGKLHWRSERGAQVYVRCDRTAVASR
jgi:hypothetical protein